jgi:subtilase family serine protease
LHPWKQLGFDRGRVAPEATIGLVTVFLKRTPAKQADLETLLANQQNPASADYRRWLTPEQFANRFGASVKDASAVSDWLRSRGLKVDRIARGRNWVSFSGSAAQVEAALCTELHRYFAGGAMHVSPLIEPSIPSALASIVDGFAGLDDFDVDQSAIALAIPTRRRSTASRPTISQPSMT